MLHARLGKSYARISDKLRADDHLGKAIEAFAEDGWILRDASELLSALELIDRNQISKGVETFGELRDKSDRKARP